MHSRLYYHAKMLQFLNSVAIFQRMAFHFVCPKTRGSRDTTVDSRPRRRVRKSCVPVVRAKKVAFRVTAGKPTIRPWTRELPHES